MSQPVEYVLLWSQSQNAFHIERTLDMLEANRRAFLEDRRMDYVAVLHGTRDECSDLADQTRDVLCKREMNRRAAQDAIEQASRQTA